MNTCDIRHVQYKDSFRWKWRHVRADGTVRESAESYPLFYECVLAARENGYEPRLASAAACAITTSSPRALASRA